MAAIGKRKRDEFIARDFLTDETWNEWKRDLDDLLAFRKTIKGKPDTHDRALLDMDAPWVDFYKTILWHSGLKDCTCRSCEKWRASVAALSINQIFSGITPVWGE